LQIDGVALDYGGDDQVQTTCPMALILIGTITDFTEPVEEYSAAKSILLLTLVEGDVTTPAQFWVLRPLQSK
jgi:hypothetical protein